MCAPQLRPAVYTASFLSTLSSISAAYCYSCHYRLISLFAIDFRRVILPKPKVSSSERTAGYISATSGPNIKCGDLSPAEQAATHGQQSERHTMEDEMAVSKLNMWNVWTLVDQHRRDNPHSCKSVFSLGLAIL